jgi:hypothetical protein
VNADHADLEARFAAPAERDLPSGRHNEHREIFMEHMLTANREAESAAAQRHRRPRRRILAVSGTAVAVIAAAAVAVTVIGTSAAPSRPPSGGHAISSARTSPLIQLASYITANAHRQPGDATLMIRTSTSTTGEPSGSYVDLYTDSGAYYGARTESGLPSQIAEHHNLGHGMFAREIAAAIFAANNGNLATAREKMADDPALDSGSAGSVTAGTSQAAIAKAMDLGIKRAPGQSLAAAVNAALFNNMVWVNSVDALVAGAGNPEVRAGVLRLLSTVPGITVTHATADGQSTLVVTDATRPNNVAYEQTLTLNAHTGNPVEFTGGAVGKTADFTVTYKVSRVTLAAVVRGKF